MDMPQLRIMRERRLPGSQQMVKDPWPFIWDTGDPDIVFQKQPISITKHSSSQEYKKVYG